MLADERGVVVHQALDAGHRRLLHDEVREAHLDVAGVGLQPRRHLVEHRRGTTRPRSRARAVQDLDEARHVRALEVVGQVHVHVEVRDRVLLAARAVLDPHRVADVLDADAVDRDPAGVGAALHVLDQRGDARWSQVAGCHEWNAESRGLARSARTHAASRTISVLSSRRPGSWRQRPRRIARVCRPTSARCSRPGRRASRPAAARQSSREPCSMKRSGMPSCSTGICSRCACQQLAATAEPAPPATAFSSSVTMARWRAAIASDQILVQRLDEAHVDQRWRRAARRSPARGSTMRAEREQRQPAAALARAPRRARWAARVICCSTGTPGPRAARIAHGGRCSPACSAGVQHLPALVLVARAP